MRISNRLLQALAWLIVLTQVGCVTVVRRGGSDDDDAVGDDDDAVGDDDDAVGDDDDAANSPPFIVLEETYWLCEYSQSADDYFFEFQTLVDDLDGPGDVVEVLVTVLEAGTEFVIDEFGLIYEGDGLWGGIVWELESELYEWCGEPIDVRFDAWDYAGANDWVVLYY